MKAKAYWSEKERVVSACLSDQIDDWQPLLTEAEWRARYPLALRKLGEGEEVKSERWYLSVAKDRDPELHYSGCLRALNGMRYEVHELPPLPPAESEPTIEETFGIQTDDPDAPGYFHVPFKKVGTKKCKFKPAPAPNSVGERLTEPPEVGTPVVRFMNSEEPSIFQFRAGSIVPRGEVIRYYRWHGPIPQEPTEPEKPEPPKWLGAVRRNMDGMVAWIVSINPNRRFCTGIGREKNRWPLCTYDAIHPDHFTLAPDIMPPSPELAKLFGEEVCFACHNKRWLWFKNGTKEACRGCNPGGKKYPSMPGGEAS